MRLLSISDNEQNNLVIVNLQTMSVDHIVSVGRAPYPVDLISANVVLVSTRGETSVVPVDVSAGTAQAPVSLTHKPRSTTKHRTRPLALIGGADRAYTSVLDTGSMQVLFSVGSGSTSPYRDFGGSLACGHPAWHDELIIHLDRIARRIELYDFATQELIDSANLPTSGHHVARVDDNYYMICEGNRSSLVLPSVVKFQIVSGRIKISANRFLPIPRQSYSSTGGHHLTVDGENQRIYVGTADARLFALGMSELEVLNYIDTGPGCGHVTLCPEIGRGVTTNHMGTAMTVFDLSSGRRIGEISVSSAQTGSKKTQGHTSRWDSNVSRLYSTAAQDGKIMEIDPAALAIARELSISGAYLIQGCFS